MWDICAVEVPEEDLERLRALRGVPAIVAANHPSLAEPVVLFEVLRRGGQLPFMTTAHDPMTRYGRLSASLFQRLGGHLDPAGAP